MKHDFVQSRTGDTCSAPGEKFTACLKFLRTSDFPKIHEASYVTRVINPFHIVPIRSQELDFLFYFQYSASTENVLNQSCFPM
uniref:Uncharacterized protein n=1 Tax=Anguilla anguilla TaxID=7936 RepID=A0A0E9X5N2_ANGAN